ncbi:formimidoylglutamate deiminase [Xanthomonas arboricola pv. juglandis]|uniref:formimidoylglutamate deiminase n=1 Tax=Xanthomonas arboricola TaxID=56448 RepID=UPI00063EA4A2|nr:formimidoylglutamate deiminase [Xanthomonas arboricola]MDN0220986.1 formimidoylglutamate deiminase [Xanthomonas arboricola pv. juglandis]MDN0225448.1 formimidoylglutamate deiminase [Xanthomonas arboricola pv. juglandis]MDN0229594.1 formimidoylglutamate deiminase [Xanthomonas arboricola pv. juglandis]MDN0233897.1 formimidoylglutamate deiminase [Xanthomonas arboricola pv. juglandis]MDN0238312.1 formimidoylglutamate deiminase [Xanthomonas arboricola pv. juglandis]
MADQQVQALWAARALLPDGCAGDVRITLAQGRIASVQPGATPAADDTRVERLLPGLGNLHSHAFQRGMAGLTEVGGRSGDSFWSWRELMYRFVDRLDPDSLQVIAEQAYVEMLESGFTRVGEFHYLHHSPGGAAYAQAGEMSGRIAAAAANTGIGLTLLPVFYAHADFGGVAPSAAQRRLIHDIDGFARLLDDCKGSLKTLPDAVLGLAPHSLRAVTPEQLAALVPLTDGPIHIHIAEQQREVQACLAWSGQRPLQWLLANAPVDARWCLVHATHVDASELQGIVDNGAVVGLCPITEANLGDGLFPMQAFAAAGGRFGVGSDSNVLIDAAEELRLLEYGQRLQLQARNVLAQAGASSGRWLFEQAGEGAAQALGVARSGIRVGASADLLELDPTHPALLARNDDALLDSWLFAARGGAVRTVWRAGQPVVRDGRHVDRTRVAARFAGVLQSLLSK